MENDIKSLFAAKIKDFRLPRYNELPNVGLYLEQVTKYINGFMEPLGCHEITSSMVSNYVKKGVISAPVKKQYYAEQIAYLIFINISKSVLSMEHINLLFDMQRSTYDAATAYNYFCLEFENMLMYVSGVKDTVEYIGTTNTETKNMLRNVIVAAAHIIFTSNCFDEIKKRNTELEQ